MKLREIQVENFGALVQRRFEFFSGFCVVYGPNEAGKSTLLQLLREALFGFPHRSPYKFDSHSGAMRARVLGVTDAGREFEFTRYKRRSHPVEGKYLDTGEPLDGEGLARLLGGSSQERYDNVFGLSLAELASGSESLAKGHLDDALFGGGLGSLQRFQTLQETIERELAALWKSRAQKPEINQAVQEIMGAQAALDDAIVAPHQYAALEAEYEEALALKSSLQNELVETSRRRSDLEKRLASLEAAQTIAAARRELETLQAPSALEPRSGERYEKVVAELARLDKRFTKAEAALRQTERQIAELQLDDELVEQSGATRRIVGKRALFTSDVSELPEKEQSFEREIDHITRLLASLGAELRAEPVAGRSAAALLGELDAACSGVERALADLPGIDALERHLQGREKYSTDRTQLEERRAFLATRRAAFSSEETRLRGEVDVDPAADLLAIAVLPEATLSAYVERFAQAREKERDRRRDVERAEDSLEDLRQQLDSLHQGGPVPPVSQLERLRAERDEVWAWLRDRLDAHDAATAGERRARAELLTTRIESADRLADERQEKAKNVAKIDNLEAAIGRAEDDVRRSRLRLEESAASTEQLESQWRAEWSESPLRCRSSEAMADWAKAWSAWRQDGEQIEEGHAGLRPLEISVGAFEDRLRELLGSSAADESAGVAEWLDIADARVADIERRRDDLAKTREALSRARSLEREVTALQTRIHAYRAEAMDLIGSRAPDLSDWPLEQAVEELDQRLGRAMEAANSRRHLDQQRAASKELLAEHLNSREEFEKERARLLQMAGTEREEEFLARAKDAARRGELQQSLEESRRILRQLAPEGGSDLDSLEKELAATDRVSLEFESKELEAAKRDAEQRHEAAILRVGEAERRLAELEKGTEVGELQIELDSCRARVEELVDQWAPLVLAKTAIERTRERFQRGQQSELLQVVCRLLSDMTGGRYARVERRLDGSPGVVDRGGEERMDKELSTGTREQLYLAIRLGWLLDYCVKNESLPVVLDDVLVNFDAERARATLRVLVELSRTTQVIYLTCHRDRIAWLEELDAKASVIEL